MVTTDAGYLTLAVTPYDEPVDVGYARCRKPLPTPREDMTRPAQTETRPLPTHEQAAAAEAARLQLSAVQVLGGAAAAVSAAVVCSFVGVAGTVAGTAVASVVATVSTALYTHSARVATARLHRMHPQSIHPRASAHPVFDSLQRTARMTPRHLPWKAMAAGSVAVFVLAIGIVTGIEALAGRPVAAMVGGANAGERGTTFGGVVRPRPAAPAPSTTPTPGQQATTAPASPTAPPPARGAPSQSPVQPPAWGKLPSPGLTSSP